MKILRSFGELACKSLAVVSCSSQLVQLMRKKRKVTLTRRRKRRIRRKRNVDVLENEKIIYLVI